MTLPVIRLTFFFRWYDLWIGVYIDRKAGAVYICPLPTLGVKIEVIRWEQV